VSTPQVVALLEELGLYSRTPGIYIIYGAPAVGKTTLMARFVWELAELGVPTFYVGTEPNLKLYGQLEKIREKLPRVFKCGYREIATVEYADSYLPLLHKAVEVTGHCGEAVLVVDSITAIALHEQSRYLAATGRLDVLPIVRTMSSFANAMTQLIANNIASKAISVYYVAQERPAIGQTYHGEPAAPSFAMRAQHNVQAVARLTVSAEGKRTLKVVWHRISKYAGATKEVHIEPLI
jgi:archaellum biogenesis ATPase FlaH